MDITMEIAEYPKLPFSIGSHVELTIDLTHYNKTLTLGITGVIITGESRKGDRFCIVNFKEAGMFDILYENLKYVEDEAYLKKYDEHKAKYRKEIASAHDAVLITGPKGGFQKLEYKYRIDDGPIQTRRIYDRNDYYLWRRNLTAFNIPINVNPL